MNDIVSPWRYTTDLRASNQEKNVFLGQTPSLSGVLRAVSRGEAKKALLYYEEEAAKFEALASSAESGDYSWGEVARAYREASNAAHFLGDLHKAIVYGEKALELAEKLGNRRLKLAILSSLVWAHGSARNFTKTEKLIDIAFELAKQFPLNSLDWMWWHGVFSLHRGTEFRRRQIFDRAVEDYARAVQLKTEYLKTVSHAAGATESRRELARNGILSGYAGLGETYLSMTKYNEAREAFQGGLKTAKEWKLEFYQNRFYLGLGDIGHRRKDFAGALENFHKALDLALRQQRPNVISSAARRIGDVLRDTGKRTEAIASYKQAIQETESIRSLLATESARQAYFAGWLGSYWGMTETLWETGAYNQAFHYGERVRSRAFLDVLGTKVALTRLKNAAKLGLSESSDPGDSENSYRAFIDKVRIADPEQASLMNVEPPTVAQVQALLEPRQALIEYLVTPRKTYLWVVDKNRSHALVVRASQKDLAAKVQALRSAISDLKPLKDYQILARDLYQQLIAPATSLINGKELIIVPHDALHYLPFQALYSERGRYLVEDHAVTYLSSASLMHS